MPKQDAYNLVKAGGKVYIAVSCDANLKPNEWGKFDLFNIAGIINISEVLHGEHRVEIAVHEWLHARNFEWRENEVSQHAKELAKILMLKRRSRRSNSKIVKEWMGGYSGFGKRDHCDLIDYLYAPGVAPALYDD